MYAPRQQKEEFDGCVLTCLSLSLSLPTTPSHRIFLRSVAIVILIIVVLVMVSRSVNSELSKNMASLQMCCGITCMKITSMIPLSSTSVPSSTSISTTTVQKTTTTRCLQKHCHWLLNESLKRDRQMRTAIERRHGRQRDQKTGMVVGMVEDGELSRILKKEVAVLFFRKVNKIRYLNNGALACLTAFGDCHYTQCEDQVCQSSSSILNIYYPCKANWVSQIETEVYLSSCFYLIIANFD